MNIIDTLTLIDERTALIKMLQRNSFGSKSIMLTDRGFMGYEMFIHLATKKNLDFACRIPQNKNNLSNKELSFGSSFPSGEFDENYILYISPAANKKDRAIIQFKKENEKVFSKKKRYIDSFDF